MQWWLEEQLALLNTNETSEAFFTELQKITHKLGFDYCAYGIKMPYPLSAPHFELLNSYPDEWQVRYQREDYLTIDPTVHHGLSSNLPLLWNDQVFSGAEHFREDAAQFGLEYGWAQASHNPNGSVGMLSLSRSDEEIESKELEQLHMQLLWLNQVAHQGLSERIMNEKMPLPKLSNREVEMLKWTADGKTAEEIAMILGITARTVNFHISKAIEKLDVANKTAATVKAFALGLL